MAVTYSRINTEDNLQLAEVGVATSAIKPVATFKAHLPATSWGKDALIVNLWIDDLI